jgi:hypothetical protein
LKVLAYYGSSELEVKVEKLGLRGDPAGTNFFLWKSGKECDWYWIGEKKIVV